MAWRVDTRLHRNRTEATLGPRLWYNAGTCPIFIMNSIPTVTLHYPRALKPYPAARRRAIAAVEPSKTTRGWWAVCSLAYWANVSLGGEQCVIDAL